MIIGCLSDERNGKPKNIRLSEFRQSRVQRRLKKLKAFRKNTLVFPLSEINNLLKFNGRLLAKCALKMI